MLILAIETSCDETAVAVVENGRRVSASVIASQIDIHQATGGVVPEVAAREHVLKIRAVIEEALKKADLKLAEIDAFTVTQGPGLLSSLIIGYSAAVTLARVLGKPLIPVHHVAGHIYSNWLEADEPVQFPVMILTVSGGHNELVLMKEEMDFELIGETLDDAAGEAYDKVARLLGLGYPGGPAISKVAEGGNSQAINFTRALSTSDNFNFSFSGLKSAVLREVEKYHQENGKLDAGFVADCAASFQESVNDSLSEKLLLAAKKYSVKEIHLAGGVSANKNLRASVEEKMEGRFSAKDTMTPRLRYNKNLQYCTDNAAMIGAAAYFKFQKDPTAYGPEAKAFPEPQLDLYSSPAHV
jgi:N6-L-threonylcarbamoyladenine synthase